MDYSTKVTRRVMKFYSNRVCTVDGAKCAINQLIILCSQLYILNVYSDWIVS